MQNDGQTFKINQILNLLQSNSENNSFGIDECLKLPGEKQMDISVDSTALFLSNRSVQQMSNGQLKKPKVNVGDGKREKQMTPLEQARHNALRQKQAMLFQVKNVFKAICLPEVRIVNRLLCKFQFVNEDILRSQVINELTNFTNKDRLI